MNSPRRRLAALAASIVLAAAFAAGCSSENADVDCSLDRCTVTMNRGVDAQASVLGVDITLVGVSDGQVTVDVEGTEVRLPVGDNQGTTVGGVRITVQEVTDDNVVLDVTQE